MEQENKQTDKNPILEFFANLIGAIKLHLPKPPITKNEPAVSQAEPVVAKPSVMVVEDETDNNVKKQTFVMFPKQEFPPLKLEAEVEDSERSTNPLLLWQVYAIGGFFVMRWAWTRWNERKGQKKPGDEPPPSED